MIRRIRAKSSLSYPEVVHRFCGYLGARKKFCFARARRRARVVKRQTDELSLAREKKIRRRADEGGLAVDGSN
jgi:hypothetical protein